MAKSPIWDVGDTVNFRFRCMTVAGVPADPAVVTVEIKAPTAAKVTYIYGASGSPIVKNVVGDYSVAVKFTEADAVIAGVSVPWQVIWTGSGAGSIECEEPAYAHVRPRAFA